MYDKTELEFNKILDTVKQYAFLSLTKDKIEGLEPLQDIFSLNCLLDKEEEAIRVMESLGNIPLDFIQDIREELKMASIGSILSSEQLYKVLILIQRTTSLKNYLRDINNKHLDITNLNEYFISLSDNKKLGNEIESAIDENFNVKDNASMSLFKVRKRIQMEENHLRSYMNSLLMKESSRLTENIIVMRDNRMCLCVKADSKNQIKGIIHDQSSSGTTFFIEPEEASVIYKHIEELRVDEKKEVNLVLKGLTLLVESHSDELLNDFKQIEELDFVFALARYARENGYTRPVINQKGYFNLINAAHPLIDKEVVVKNNVKLGQNYSTIIITGPNTGGKTVVLKLVGLLTLMSLSGLFISADENSEVSFVKNILVDIGDEQSIEQNLSTFSSHMTRIANIFKHVTSDSLVLLDEVGSGTDPKEGASLAIAIIDKLTKSGCRLISTTHYSDLKAFAYNNKNIVNASVEFDSENLAPTYKLSIGVPGSSNAILISRRLGLDEDILKEAESLINNNTTESGSLIKKIDEENQNVVKLRQNYEKKLKELEYEKKKFEEKNDEFEKNKELMLYKAHLEANKIINDAKEKSSELIEELNRLKNEKSLEDKDLAKVKFESKNLKSKEEKKEDNHNLVVGDLVHVIDYHKTGEVIDIKKGKYVVQFGQFKMAFNRDELLYDKSLKKEEKKVVKPTSTVTLASTAAPMKLDLRGERYVDVQPQVDLFIDRAILAHYNTVYIVHGFGTGAVRKAVEEALKKNKHVKESRFGGDGEGLNGCTVVTLK